MRCLDKNKRNIHFKTYTGKEQIVDANGYKTGDYRKTYGSLVSTKMSLAQSGQAVQEAFGVSERYSLVAMTDDLGCTMDENSIVWINTPTTGPFNFIVRRKIVGLNHITYGLTEVEVHA